MIEVPSKDLAKKFFSEGGGKGFLFDNTNVSLPPLGLICKMGLIIITRQGCHYNLVIRAYAIKSMLGTAKQYSFRNNVDKCDSCLSPLLPRECLLPSSSSSSSSTIKHGN